MGRNEGKPTARPHASPAPPPPRRDRDRRRSEPVILERPAARSGSLVGLLGLMILAAAGTETDHD